MVLKYFFCLSVHVTDKISGNHGNHSSCSNVSWDLARTLQRTKQQWYLWQLRVSRNYSVGCSWPASFLVVQPLSRRQIISEYVRRNSWYSRYSPSSSTDLKPWDFHFRGQLKHLAQPAWISNEETLHIRMFAACQTVYKYPQSFAIMRQSIIRLSIACTNSGEGRFEHLLQIVTW
jgi:hypothetical protein